MAFYIAINKTSQDETTVRYQFASGARIGSFEIEKATGQVTLIDEMPDDTAGRHFERAAVKIMRAWKAGEMPDFAEWAS